MEVIPDCVVDETFRSLSLTTGLVLENHIIIPPEHVEFNVQRLINWRSQYKTYKNEKKGGNPKTK